VEKNKFYIYQKVNTLTDGSGYSFFVDGRPLNEIQKLTLTALRRTPENKRADMAMFYIDYRVFRSMLTVLENRLRSNIECNIKLRGGTDAKRALTILSKDKTVFFNFYDNSIQNKHESYKSYTGKIMFPIKNALDLQELFDTKITLSNWELTQIQRLLSDTEENKNS
jgi:hypothetical protein